MENYQFKQRVRANTGHPTPEFIAAVSAKGAQIPFSRMSAYKEIDLGNARLRWLWNELAARRAADVPWISPSLPCCTLGGAFSDAASLGLAKCLVFSSSAVAPRAISTLLSYQAEQAAAGTEDRYRKRHATPLRLARDAPGRLGSMPMLSLVYPSLVLAEIGDHRAAAAALDQLQAATEDTLAVVRQRIGRELAKLPAGASDGRVDRRWYWAVLFALDRLADPTGYGWHLRAESGCLDDGDTESLYNGHLAEALLVNNGCLAQLGRPPPDLVESVARLAVAGPATCALRALGQVMQETSLSDDRLREAAQAVGLAFRTLVNSREVSRLVTRIADTGAYHRSVLSACLDGNLQAVLDEYVHVLVESEGLQGAGEVERIATLKADLRKGMAQRSGTPQVDLYKARGEKLTPSNQVLRTHFAVRYGRETSADAILQTEADIRDAFNSPFWPLVLASTSVGQGGLDFHTYCHAVAH